MHHRNRIASREKEEQFQLAVECADVGTWEWNLSNDEFVWSERCRQMFGVAKETKMTLQRFLETIHSDDRERTRACSAGKLRSIKRPANWKFDVFGRTTLSIG